MSKLEPLELAGAERVAGVPGRRDTLPLIVSLFCGAGGLDLGFKQAGFKVELAFDSSTAAINTHRRNFRRTKAVVLDLSSRRIGELIEYVRARVPEGSRIGVIGGPPCQGFSRANNSSGPRDPRNKLARAYAEIVAALSKIWTVEFFVLENVLGIRDKKHKPAFDRLQRRLRSLGFDVNESELCALDYGVAQNRRRVLLYGVRAGAGYGLICPRKRSSCETVRDAIGHISVSPKIFQQGERTPEIPLHPNHWTMKPKSPRFKAGKFSSSERSFKLLRWDQPSPTIAFGNREIHVHPNKRRRLSIFEAMLLQGFPDSFVITGNLSEQVEQVSNAVPPPLARSVANAIKRAIGQTK